MIKTGKQIKKNFYLTSLTSLIIILLISVISIIKLGLFPVIILLIILGDYFINLIKNFINLKSLINRIELNEKIIYSYSNRVFFTNTGIFSTDYSLFSVYYEDIKKVYKMGGIHLGNHVKNLNIVCKNRKKYKISFYIGNRLFISFNNEIEQMMKIIKEHNEDVKIGFL